MNEPKLHVDAFSPVLARLVGAIDRARVVAATFEVLAPALPSASPDLVLDGVAGVLDPLRGTEAPDDEPIRRSRA